VRLVRLPEAQGTIYGWHGVGVTSNFHPPLYGPLLLDVTRATMLAKGASCVTTNARIWWAKIPSALLPSVIEFQSGSDWMGSLLLVLTQTLFSGVES